MWNFKKFVPLFLLATVNIGPALAGNGEKDCESGVEGPAKAAESQNDSNRNEIIADLYAAKSTDNTVFSMFSLDSVMTLVGGGFRDDVLNLLTATYLGRSLNDFAAIMQRAKHSSPDITFSSADAVWLNNNMRLLPGYLQYMGALGLPDSRSIDVSDPKGSASQINQWSSDATKGLVPKIVEPGMINSDTFAILTNAVYFKAPWSSKFDPKNTKLAPFNSIQSGKLTPTSVSMMHKYNNKVEISYNRDDSNKDETIATLRLTYAGNRYAMYLNFAAKNLDNYDQPISVDATIPLEKLVRFSSNPNLFAQTFRNQTFGTFAMPKFRVSSEIDNVKKIFEQNGLSAIFNTGVLSRLTDRSNAYIEFIVHAAQFVNDEFGGEGGATSAVGIGLETVMTFRDLHIDGPFIFSIRDHETEQTIFQGAIRNPAF